MKICIAGGSGFIGKNLVYFLKDLGHEIALISHKQLSSNNAAESIRNSEIVINLMGESIAGRWTMAKRGRIMESRMKATQTLMKVVKMHGSMVRNIIGVSAVGVYDSVHTHTEESLNYSEGFLKEVVINWESAYLNAGIHNARICIMRLGVVLGNNGGMLLKLEKILPRFVGIIIKGQRNFTFVHIADLLSSVDFVIKNEFIEGIVNVTSPYFISIESFYKLWASVRKVVVRLYVFKWVMKIALGEAAELLFDGQRVIPEKLLKAGFVFSFENPESALLHLRAK